MFVANEKDGIKTQGQQSPSRWRLPRFSLLTLLLLVAILALSITVIFLWREVKPLRAENKRLHEERGTLMIDDRSRLHAIQIPSRFAGEGRDSFRVFVPDNSRYWVFLVVNKIAKEGYPKLKRYPREHGMLGSGTNLPLFGRLDPGEHVVSVQKVRRGDNRWDVQLIVDGLDATANTRADEWPTVEFESFQNFGEGVTHRTTPAKASGRLILKRRRVQPVSQELLTSSFLLWIEHDPGKRNAAD